MIIGNLDINGVFFFPLKADPVLVINPYTELPFGLIILINCQFDLQSMHLAKSL